MADRVGQQFGNYRLIRLLGEGGFAEVYLAEHLHLGTQAAIKVLHTQLASDDLEKFRAEGRTLAHCQDLHAVLAGPGAFPRCRGAFARAYALEP